MHYGIVSMFYVLLMFFRALDWMPNANCWLFWLRIQRPAQLKDDCRFYTQISMSLASDTHMHKIKIDKDYFFKKKTHHNPCFSFCWNAPELWGSFWTNLWLFTEQFWSVELLTPPQIFSCDFWLHLYCNCINSDKIKLKLPVQILPCH